MCFQMKRQPYPSDSGKAGYETFGFNTNYHLIPRFGFAQGFDHFKGDTFADAPFPGLFLESELGEIRRYIISTPPGLDNGTTAPTGPTMILAAP